MTGDSERSPVLRRVSALLSGRATASELDFALAFCCLSQKQTPVYFHSIVLPGYSCTSQCYARNVAALSSLIYLGFPTQSQ